MDARTDIFAFGAVLYEMTTGRMAFEGKSHAGLIAAILEHDPAPISAVLQTSPPTLDRVVKKALAKDPAERWQTARDLKDELKWIATEMSPAVSVARPLKSHRRRNWVIGLFAAAVLLAALLTGLKYLSLKDQPESLVRFSIPLPPETMFTTTETAGPTSQLAVSPDGRMVVFAASRASGRSSLWMHVFDSFTSQMLPGTEGASFPFWSPDSRYVGFFADRKLKKVDLSGGPPQAITDAPAGRGGTWNPQGVIVFADDINTGLKQVSAAGGTPRIVTTLDASRGELSHRFPAFLPDGRHFLYVNRAATKYLGLYAGSLDSKEIKRVLPGKWSTARVVGRYLLSVREGTLMPHPFDAGSLGVTGTEFPIAEQIGSASPSGFAAFSASYAALAYASGSSPNRQLIWFSREGKRLSSLSGVGEYSSPALAPNEKTVAVARIDPQTRTPDIWLFDLVRGTETRFTFDPGSDRAPFWSAGGKEILFSSDRSGVWDLYRKAVNGTRAERSVVASPHDEFPSQVSSDSQFVVYHTPTPNTHWDLWVLPLHDPSKPIPFVRTVFNEVQGVLSPDGKSIAYTSDETGRPEVYVQSFPAPGGKWQVSVHGGSEPEWRPDGRELFYVSADAI